MVSCPLAEPAVWGLKVRVTEIDWPGFKLAGRITADAENPLPLTAIEFTVTGAVPVDVSVTVCVVGVLTTTEPNGTEVAFAVRVEAAAFN
jgi:hypothetical protein